MSGTDAIIEKILSDARSIVNSTLEEANNFCAKEIAEAQNDVKIYREKNMSESYAEREEIIRRKITVGNLEVKKILLQTKQELIADAFEKAMIAVKDDKKAYEKLVKNMLKLAEDGDTVIFSESDKDIFDEKWLKANCGKKVTLSKEYGKFFGGIFLTCGGSDKNMTLEVELSAVRNAYEPQIAGLLFGE